MCIKEIINWFSEKTLANSCIYWHNNQQKKSQSIWSPHIQKSHWYEQKANNQHPTARIYLKAEQWVEGKQKKVKLLFLIFEILCWISEKQ